MTKTAQGEFQVLQWCSHPDEDNDDCSTGSDHETLAEAEAAFAKPARDYTIAWIELTGPGVVRLRRNPSHDAKRCARESAAADREWQRERAMQAGMGLGVDAYNDEMGWGE